MAKNKPVASSKKKATRIRSLPKNASERVRDTASQLATFTALDAVASSEGGRIIVDSLTKDVVAAIETLSVKYKTATHIELITICADVENKLAIIRLITRAKTNRTFFDGELREALKEEGLEEEESS